MMDALPTVKSDHRTHASERIQQRVTVLLRAVRRQHPGGHHVAVRNLIRHELLVDRVAAAFRHHRELRGKEMRRHVADGEACAALITPGQNVIIDGGTTCFHVAKRLDEKVVQIITNSLPVANLFSASNRHEVHLSGGVIYPRLGVLVGPNAVETFSRMHADVAILSGSGISEDGIYNSHALLVDIQRAMIAGAAKVIFCIDHTKFDRRSTFFLSDFSAVDTIVTDAGAPADLVTRLRAKGLEVIVASSGA